MSLDSLPISLTSNESENETDEKTFCDACVTGDLRIVKIYLSQQEFDMNVDGNTGFQAACASENLNIVQFLVQKGCDMNFRDDDGLTGFHYACLNGNLNVVQFLVQKGYNMNVGDDDGRTGFHYACENGNLNVVQFLVRQGFDMNMRDDKHGITGFDCACTWGNLNVVQFLLQQGYNMNDDTGFNVACECGNLNVVQFLVQKGFDMNVGDNNGYTTGFHGACYNENLNVVQFLVRQGFDMNARDNDGNTGLDILIEEERFLPCALFLIEAGATLNENDVFEELFSAIQNRIIEITFTEQTIFQKWTGRIAQAITDFTMEPYSNISLQNLSQILD